ncbi:MAG: DNA-directed RNA polymerase subunit omega [Candidatus Marinimicrobia bacterium]|nr:DNA-directed RNA polymerase subunit omega [Candidatus Neomarinimicrobiota bacterium]
MALKPLSVRDMEEKTMDVFEAVVVMTKRSKQIIHQRLVEKALNTEGEEQLSALDPIPEEKDPEDYIELEKPSTVAINDFMSGKVKWHYINDIDQ